MKKVLLLFFSFATYTGKAQYRGSIYHPQALQKLEALSKKYFGHNPFQTGLPKLVDFICQDTAVYVDTVISHTDTSNFYIRAHHKQFNPFGIGLDSVRIIVAERKRGVLSSKQIIDTVYYLQTEGIAVGQNQVKNLRTAFQRMHEEVSSILYESRYQKTKDTTGLRGEGYYYFEWRKDVLMPVASIAWHKRNENVAVIVISLILHLEQPSAL